MVVCSHCDSLIFDYTDSTYVLFNMGNLTGIGFIIEEDGVRWYSDKIYNLQGKELHYIPVGTMYIRNQRLYISK